MHTHTVRQLAVADISKTIFFAPSSHFLFLSLLRVDVPFLSLSSFCPQGCYPVLVAGNIPLLTDIIEYTSDCSSVESKHHIHSFIYLNFIPLLFRISQLLHTPSFCFVLDHTWTHHTHHVPSASSPSPSRLHHAFFLGMAHLHGIENSLRIKDNAHCDYRPNSGPSAYPGCWNHRSNGVCSLYGKTPPHPIRMSNDNFSLENPLLNANIWRDTDGHYQQPAECK